MVVRITEAGASCLISVVTCVCGALCRSAYLQHVALRGEVWPQDPYGTGPLQNRVYIVACAVGNKP